MAVPAREDGDDGALVLAVQQGDAGAFDALFRRHYPSVRRACLRRLVDHTEADEVAQAAFVRAFERIDQCSGLRRFGPWVHVIARSLCMDAFRARARVEPFEEPMTGRRDHRPNEPEESLLREERAAHVHEALAALPERQRSAVIARDVEELRPSEIADRLGVSIGAVDSLLLRARRRMALSYRRLAGEGGGGASTHTLRSAAAVAGVALLAGPQAVMAASAAAADAVSDTASRAAVGVVGAVVSVALSVGAAVTPPPAVPDAPVTATTVVVGLPATPSPARTRVAPAGGGEGAAVQTTTPDRAAGPAPAVPTAVANTATPTGTGPPQTTTSLPTTTTVPPAVPPSPPPAGVVIPSLPDVPITTGIATASPPPPAPPATPAPPAPTPAPLPPPAVAVEPTPVDVPVLPPVTTPIIHTVVLDVGRP